MGHLATGLGVAALLPGELLALGTADPSVIWCVVTLFAALGLAIGMVIAGVEALVARWHLRPGAASMLRASAGLLAFGPLLRHLFDGGMAATLPGASAGHLWSPLAACILLAGVIRVALAIRRRRTLGLALIGFGVCCAVLDGRLYPRGYGDLHLLLEIAASVAFGLAVRFLVNGDAAPTRARLFPSVIVGSVIFASFALTLRYGLSTQRARWVVVTHWTGTARMVRVLRAAIDRDGDGYSSVLGGPDCDDHDAKVNPLAAEVPGNDVDENCDGFVAPPGTAVVAPQVAVSPKWNGSAAFAARGEVDDVLLLCVDALRAELVFDTPENRQDFPHVMQLLDESHVFRRAFSTSATTAVAFPSIVTGQFDPFHRFLPTLPEVVRSGGWETHAVIPHEALVWVGEEIITRGLDQFDHVGDSSRDKAAPTSARTTELGLRFVDSLGGRRGYLWLHYFDVHEHGNLVATSSHSGNGASELRREYRSAFRLVDSELGRLIDGLRERHRWDRALVVFLADHGEGLGDDPRLPFDHNEYVYNPLVHVPLLVRVPGVSPAVHDEPVSIVDVLPTIADLVGRPLSASMDGVSLAPTILGAPSGPVTPRDILLSDARQYALVQWPWKLLVRPKDNLVELYDLANDFGERRDLAAEQPARVREMAERYQRRATLPLDESREARHRREEYARKKMIEAGAHYGE
jgi:hypothetical protein